MISAFFKPPSFLSGVISVLAIATHATAMDGANIPFEELPDQSCKIAYERADGTRAAFCSGTLISNNLVLTAIHCEQAAEERAAVKTKVTCGRIPESHWVLSRIRNPDFDSEGVFYGTYDVAILKVDEPFNFEPAEVPESENDLNALLETGLCGIFGYGLPKLGVAQGYVGPSSVFVDGNTNRRNPDGSSLPETRIQFEIRSQPGDSGGGVLCKRQKMRWSWREFRNKPAGAPYGNWIIAGFISHDGLGNSLAPNYNWMMQNLAQ